MFSLKHLVIVFCFLFLSFLLHQPLKLNINKPKFDNISAIYVFGDSLVDGGNTIHLVMESPASSLPYGIDFEGGKPTGRHTNGKTVIDFIGNFLGLPPVPPYLGLPQTERRKIATGINYASASSGILSQTHNGSCLPLETQIELFQRTVAYDLPQAFKNTKALEKHLSQSLFFVSTGVNDYQDNLNKTHFDPNEFAPFLLQEFSNHVKRLHNIGARRFLVNNIPPAGCFPSQAIKMKPRGACNEMINGMINIYNKGLPGLLKKLQSQLKDSIFEHSDLYQTFLYLRSNGKRFGIIHIWKPCCPDSIDSDLNCGPNIVVCKDRHSHLFFDEHPTEIVNQLHASMCYFGSNTCTRV